MRRQLDAHRRDEFPFFSWRFGYPDGVIRLFHQQGAVKKNILESDFVSLCNGTIY